MTMPFIHHKGNEGTQRKDLTESQKMYAPIPMADAEFAKAYEEMVSAYREGRLDDGKKWFDEMLRLESKIQQASVEFRKYLLKRLVK